MISRTLIDDSGWFLLFMLFMVVPYVSASGQTPQGGASGITRQARIDEDNRKLAEADLERRERILREGPRPYVPPVIPRAPSRAKEIAKKLTVDKQDYSTYEAFLKMPDTGIFKLLLNADCLPAKKNKEIKLCTANADGIKIPLNSYSFRERRYSDKTSSDFSISKNRLTAEESDFQIILANLGEVSLEDLTLESEGISFLRSFKPKVQIDEVRKQFNLFVAGIWSGKYKYSKSAELKLNNVYVIRSIAYEGNTFISSAKDASDLIIAMKLIRYEEDGSATFVWKQLLSKDAPKLVYIQVDE